MKLRVITLILFTLMVQCSSEPGSIGDFISSTFMQINSKVKEVAGAIISGISDDFNPNPKQDKEEPSDNDDNIQTDGQSPVNPDFTTVAPSSIADNVPKKENIKSTANPMDVKPTFIPLGKTTEDDFDIDVRFKN